MSNKCETKVFSKYYKHSEEGAECYKCKKYYCNNCLDNDYARMPLMECDSCPKICCSNCIKKPFGSRYLLSYQTVELCEECNDILMNTKLKNIMILMKNMINIIDMNHKEFDLLRDKVKQNIKDYKKDTMCLICKKKYSEGDKFYNEICEKCHNELIKTE